MCVVRVVYRASSNGVSGGEEDDWDYSERLDPNKEGVAVKALYDYEGVEGDELSFKCGQSTARMSLNCVNTFLNYSNFQTRNIFYILLQIFL